MKFTKMQAAGNDFVIIEDLKASLNTKKLSTLSKKLCDRHFGIGADGVILVLKSKIADYKMRIFNPDGSEAEMCGNGIRCFAKYLYAKRLIKKREINVETLAGIIKPQILNDGKIKVNMGQPRLKRKEIPMVGLPDEEVINFKLQILNSALNITCVSMGNPHCIIFVDDLQKIDFYKLGPAIENHKLFPKRTNVEFVKVLNRKNIQVRVWERGAGETLACGTGACASAVAGVLNNLVDRKVNVKLPGGTLKIKWDKKTNNVFLTGNAEIVFEGVIDRNKIPAKN